MMDFESALKLEKQMRAKGIQCIEFSLIQDYDEDYWPTERSVMSGIVYTDGTRHTNGLHYEDYERVLNYRGYFILGDDLKVHYKNVLQRIKDEHDHIFNRFNEARKVFYEELESYHKTMQSLSEDGVQF